MKKEIPKLGLCKLGVRTRRPARRQGMNPHADHFLDPEDGTPPLHFCLIFW